MRTTHLQELQVSGHVWMIGSRPGVKITGYHLGDLVLFSWSCIFRNMGIKDQLLVRAPYNTKELFQTWYYFETSNISIDLLDISIMYKNIPVYWYNVVSFRCFSSGCLGRLILLLWYQKDTNIISNFSDDKIIKNKINWIYWYLCQLFFLYLIANIL